MFTGIVQSLVAVMHVEQERDLSRIELDMGELAQGIELGASVAVNGTCLTVPSHGQRRGELLTSSKKPWTQQTWAP